MEKRIQINETEIINVITEALASWMKPKSINIDNFDLVANELQDLSNTDDFYFVQVIRRKKDNPTANFHYAEYKGYWKIKNKQELLAIKPMAMALSKQHNARIYIRMNPRNSAKTQQHLSKFIHTHTPTQQDYDEAFQKAAGWRFDSKRYTNQFPASMIDVDSDNKNVHQAVLDLLKKNNIPVWFKYETPNGGLHIMCKNRDAFKIDFSIFDGGVSKGRLSTVGLDADAATLLYADITVFGYKK